MDLYTILACPTCKVHVQRQEDTLTCGKCGQKYPIVNGVPVLLPDAVPPVTTYQHELIVRPMYDPWVPRLVMQSLPASALVLDMGAGNLKLNLPNVIRMDVTLTPYVDVVGDAHMLPFLPGTFDFVFSLAVIEHLRQPFEAAREMHGALRNGGYVYGDCNFVFAYHGYPHHYFNASEQGLEQVFSCFEKFRTGIAPYQMPSAALRMVLRTYLQKMAESDEPHVTSFRMLLNEVLEQPLTVYDALFTEEAALYVAAGTFFFGRKAQPGPTDVIPPVIQEIWEREPEVKARFPHIFDIGHAPNVMLWAKGEGRQQFSAIDDYFKSMVPFRKSDTVDDSGRELFDAQQAFDPEYAAIPDPTPPPIYSTEEPVANQRLAKVANRNKALEGLLEERDGYIKRLTSYMDEKLVYIEQLEAQLRARDEQFRALESITRRAGFSRLQRALRSLRRRRTTRRR